MPVYGLDLRRNIYARRYTGYHGIGGPVTVSKPPYDSELKAAILEAAEDKGYRIGDINGPEATGFYDLQATMRAGQRCSVAKAYLAPNDHKENLDIVSGAFVKKFGLAIHQNDHQARRRFVEWAQNEIAVVPDFHKRILFSDEAHFWLNGYVNKQNCRNWSEANPQVYVETPLHPEKLTVWCALLAGGILLQKR
ncbi:glucose dehydrogenase [Trichonephila clavipes]|nr:glucose dehydrogenase [Trichonephila clavipes]